MANEKLDAAVEKLHEAVDTLMHMEEIHQVVIVAVTNNGTILNSAGFCIHPSHQEDFIKLIEGVPAHMRMARDEMLETEHGEGSRNPGTPTH